jgi:hypothetical protein
MPFASVHDLQSSGTPGGQQLTIWLDSAAQLRDIVAKHFAKTAGFQKIALHIDEQQHALRWDKLKRIWLGLDSYRVVHIHTSPPISRIVSPRISHVLRTSRPTHPPKISVPTNLFYQFVRLPDSYTVSSR